KVSVMARPRYWGFNRKGPDALSVDRGSGRTPRNTPGSMATVAAESPRPASIWANNPPVECPITAGFFSSLPITSAVWSATCFSVFLPKPSGFARASSIVSGSSGQSGVSGAYPACLNKSAQLAQLLGSSQRPWMKTTGVLPEAFAASISLLSRSEIDAITNSFRSKSVCGRLPLLEALRDQLRPLLFVATVQHFEIRGVGAEVDAGGS